MALGVTYGRPGQVRDPAHPGGTVPETTQDELTVETPAATEEALVEESLVEEVSIDGMCGVY